MAKKKNMSAEDLKNNKILFTLKSWAAAFKNDNLIADEEEIEAAIAELGGNMLPNHSIVLNIDGYIINFAVESIHEIVKDFAAALTHHQYNYPEFKLRTIPPKYDKACSYPIALGLGSTEVAEQMFEAAKANLEGITLKDEKARKNVQISLQLEVEKWEDIYDKSTKIDWQDLADQKEAEENTEIQMILTDLEHIDSQYSRLLSEYFDYKERSVCMRALWKLFKSFDMKPSKDLPLIKDMCEAKRLAKAEKTPVQQIEILKAEIAARQAEFTEKWLKQDGTPKKISYKQMGVARLHKNYTEKLEAELEYVENNWTRLLDLFCKYISHNKVVILDSEQANNTEEALQNMYLTPFQIKYLSEDESIEAVDTMLEAEKEPYGELECWINEFKNFPDQRRCVITPNSIQEKVVEAIDLILTTGANIALESIEGVNSVEVKIIDDIHFNRYKGIATPIQAINIDEEDTESNEIKLSMDEIREVVKERDAQPASGIIVADYPDKINPKKENIFTKKLAETDNKNLKTFLAKLREI